MLRVAPADLFNFLAASESLGLLRYSPIGGTEAKAVTPEQMELSRVRAENIRLRRELEIVKKAAAYFAKDAL